MTELTPAGSSFAEYDDDASRAFSMRSARSLAAEAVSRGSKSPKSASRSISMLSAAVDQLIVRSSQGSSTDFAAGRNSSTRFRFASQGLTSDHFSNGEVDLSR